MYVISFLPPCSSRVQNIVYTDSLQHEENCYNADFRLKQMESMQRGHDIAIRDFN